MKKYWKAEAIRARIQEILPEGRVVARHNANGHFYQVVDSLDPTDEVTGPIYPSVTGKLQILKDEGLINYKMNRAVDSLREFISSSYKKLSEDNSMVMIGEACDRAKRVSQDILEDAGDVGTRIHNLREKIFNQWIETGIRPTDFPNFIPVEDKDVRVISALRALEKFCIEKDYIPVKCELLVYSHKLKTAGTLDDLGLMRQELRQPDHECDHTSVDLFNKQESTIVITQSGKHTCLKCGYQYRYEFVLMDLKTSNQFKDHYFFQVCLYWWKFWQIVGKEWKPERCFILKVSKEDGTYKIEDLKKPSKLAEFARAMIKTNEGVEFIKSLRKDNQRTVVSL